MIQNPGILRAVQGTKVLIAYQAAMIDMADRTVWAEDIYRTFCPVSCHRVCSRRVVYQKVFRPSHMEACRAAVSMAACRAAYQVVDKAALAEEARMDLPQVLPEFSVLLSCLSSYQAVFVLLENRSLLVPRAYLCRKEV